MRLEQLVALRDAINQPFCIRTSRAPRGYWRKPDNNVAMARRRRAGHFLLRPHTHCDLERWLAAENCHCRALQSEQDDRQEESLVQPPQVESRRRFNTAFTSPIHRKADRPLDARGQEVHGALQGPCDREAGERANIAVFHAQRLRLMQRLCNGLAVLILRKLGPQLNASSKKT